ncbi:XRE family transcriptional regulator [Thioclava sp. FTW29]|uniref:XRE family transcriptional regulator n=1 Tax=Thioclava litoralis TaxID=3076557 RepID=A0ABZ1E601_9RHOB|nr:XRE family transcriptional regulator [Thioclava sp. FTW29]
MPKSAKTRAPASVDPAPDHLTAQAHVPIDQRIGTAIRRKRLALKLTLADVAAGAEMSAAMLSRIENGQASASLDALERICGALGQSIAMLFAEVENKKGAAQLIRAADQLEVVRSGTRHGHTYRLLSYNRGPQKSFEPFLIEMDKDSESYPRFAHPGTEFIYMLEGEMDYQFGTQRFTLTAGDALTFSGEVEHGPAELRCDRVKFISMIVYGD